MTAAQLHSARTLIPCAFELNAPPHRPQSARLVPQAPVQVARGRSAFAPWPYVATAPAGARKLLGRVAAVLVDVALGTAAIFAVTLAPLFIIVLAGVLAVQGIRAVAAFILGKFSRSAEPAEGTP
jgi:hypothetical protein